jgi:hypothetical protein
MRQEEGKQFDPDMVEAFSGFCCDQNISEQFPHKN